MPLHFRKSCRLTANFWLQLQVAEIDEVDAARARELLDASEPPLLVDVREPDEWDEGHIPGADPRPARQPRVAHRAAPPPTARSRSSSTAPAATAPRSPRRRSRSSATRTSSRSPAATPTGSGTASRRELPRALDAREARALQPPPADPRGRRGGAAEAARLARAADRRRRPRLARRRSTSPRPASARSASSTTTSSTRRTCSARSLHSTESLGEPKAESAKRDDRGAQPRRRGRDRTRSASPPRTSTGSSPTAGT